MERFSTLFSSITMTRYIISSCHKVVWSICRISWTYMPMIIFQPSYSPDLIPTTFFWSQNWNFLWIEREFFKTSTQELKLLQKSTCSVRESFGTIVIFLTGITFKEIKWIIWRINSNSSSAYFLKSYHFQYLLKYNKTKCCVVLFYLNDNSLQVYFPSFRFHENKKTRSAWLYNPYRLYNWTIDGDNMLIHVWRFKRTKSWIT